MACCRTQFSPTQVKFPTERRHFCKEPAGALISCSLALSHVSASRARFQNTAFDPRLTCCTVGQDFFSVASAPVHHATLAAGVIIPAPVGEGRGVSVVRPGSVTSRSSPKTGSLLGAPTTYPASSLWQRQQHSSLVSRFLSLLPGGAVTVDGCDLKQPTIFVPRKKREWRCCDSEDNLFAERAHGLHILFLGWGHGQNVPRRDFS